jgi:replication fork protection complex subunit Tof1/Swi1
VVKADNEERRVALFKDNKLRLLMALVGFSRLGADNDPEATWVIPSSLTSTDLQEAIDLIRKFEFEPPAYDDGKTAEDFLRSKAASARRSTRRAEFDDDSDGIDDNLEEDRGEYAPDGPTARKSEGRKVLKRHRRLRTSVELDDEESELLAEVRRKNEIEKQRKVKSTMFVHDSDDDDWDEEKNREFFDREQAIRETAVAQIKRSLILGSTEPAVSKKRKADEQPRKERKKRKTPPKRRSGPFDSDSEDDEGDEPVVISSRESSEDLLDSDGEDEATDTPLSSQHAAAVSIGDERVPSEPSASVSRQKDVHMADADADADDDEDVAPVTRRSAARNTRAGFVIDSDSE